MLLCIWELWLHHVICFRSWLWVCLLLRLLLPPKPPGAGCLHPGLLRFRINSVKGAKSNRAPVLVPSRLCRTTGPARAQWQGAGQCESQWRQ